MKQYETVSLPTRKKAKEAFGTAVAIEMGGVSRYFSKVSRLGVDVALLAASSISRP